MPSPLSVRRVRFEVRPRGDTGAPERELLPYVDDVSLVELIADFERSAGFDVPGTYAGLMLDRFAFGDPSSYLLGRSGAGAWSDDGTVPLLGCDCGEVGCWPLQVRIRLDDAHVTWDGFNQPFRPQRDYGGLGPMVFRRDGYEHAARSATAAASRR